MSEVMWELEPLEGVPAVLTCGALAAATAMHEPMQRVAVLVPGSEVTYIPKSKFMWAAEGRGQCEYVAGELARLVGIVRAAA